MKLERFQADCFSQGATLTVKEMAEDGFAELSITLPAAGVLFQYKPNLQFVFRNRKRADGILFYPADSTTWHVLLIELKRTVSSGKWGDIKLQWHGAWLHAQALAAVLGIRLSDQVEVVAGYRDHRMAENMPDPILLKAGGSAWAAHHEWAQGRAELDELGPTRLHRQVLDENGLGVLSIT